MVSRRRWISRGKVEIVVRGGGPEVATLVLDGRVGFVDNGFGGFDDLARSDPVVLKGRFLFIPWTYIRPSKGRIARGEMT